MAQEPSNGSSQSDAPGLIWDHETGWISCQMPGDINTIRLCWLPVRLRGAAFAHHGTTAAIGARQGAVTILDFSEIIASLKDMQKALSD
jgi:hypothetical protein